MNEESVRRCRRSDRSMELKYDVSLRVISLTSFICCWSCNVTCEGKLTWVLLPGTHDVRSMTKRSSGERACGRSRVATSRKPNRWSGRIKPKLPKWCFGYKTIDEAVLPCDEDINAPEFKEFGTF